MKEMNLRDLLLHPLNLGAHERNEVRANGSLGVECRAPRVAILRDVVGVFSRFAHAVFRVQDGFVQRVKCIGGVICCVQLVFLALNKSLSAYR